MNIFYSWQSDTDKKINFKFIESAINAAISKIQSEDPDKVIHADRDTEGKSGAIRY